LSLVDGRGVVTLSRPVTCGPLRLDELEMEVPSIQFPFDLSGGSRRFRHRRCRLTASLLQLQPKEILPWLTDRLLRHTALRGITLGLDGGSFHVTGRYQQGGAAAPFLLHGIVQPDGGWLRIILLDLWVFGPLPRSAPQVAEELLRALKGSEQSQDARQIGCCDLLCDPLELALRQTLPTHGWRIPAHGDARLSEVQLAANGLSLRYSIDGIDPCHSPRPPHPDHNPTIKLKGRWRAALVAREQIEDVERLVLDDPEAAIAALTPLLDDERLRVYAEERLLQLSCTSESHDERTLEIAQASLERDAEFVPALLATAVVQQRKGQLDESARSYLRVAEICATEDDKHGEILALLASGRCVSSSDVPAARQCFERVLDLDACNLTAINQLTRICADTGDWERLAMLRQRQVELATLPEQRLQTHLALGEVFRVHLADPARALAQFKQALEIDEECEPALKGQAEACIDADRPTEAISVLDKLADLLARRGDREGEVAVHLRLASLQEHLGAPEEALAHLRRALFLCPGDAQALNHTASLLEQLGRKLEAIDALEQLLKHAAAAARPVVQLRLAELWLAVDKVDRAREQVEQVLSVDPDNATARRLALSVAERSDGPAALVDALRRTVEVEKDQGRRADLLLRLANQLLDSNGPVEEIADTLRSAAGAGLEPERLSQVWERILGRRTGDGEGTARLAELAASTFVDPTLSADRFFAAGQLWEKDVLDSEHAVRCYEGGLACCPTHGGCLDALESIWTSAGDREALVRVLSLKVDAASRQPEVQKALLCRLGELLAELGRGEEAHLSFARSLSLDAEFTPALHWLAREALEREHLDEAGQLYRRMVGSLSRDTVGLSTEERCSRLIEAHLALADLHRREGKHQEEEGHLELALAIDPRRDDLLGRLDDLLSSQERTGELVDVLRRRVEVTADPEELIGLELRRAALLERAVDRIEDAAASYRSVLAIKPDNRLALERLSILLRDLRHHGELYNTLRRRAELAEESGDPQEARSLWLDAARLANARLADTQRTATCLRRALRLAPNDPEVIDALLQIGDVDEEITASTLTEAARLQLEAGQETAAARALLAAIRQTDQPRSNRAAAARSLLALGESTPAKDRLVALSVLHEEENATATERWQLGGLLASRGQDSDAVDVLTSLPESFEHADEAHVLLGRSLSRIGRHRELAELLDRLAARPTMEPNRRVSTLLAAATLWTDEEEQPERGAASLARAARVEPFDPRVVARAGELLLGRSPGLFHSFVAEIACDPQHTPGMQASVLCHAADVLADAGAGHAAVEDALNRALERDPSYVEAVDRLIRHREEREDIEGLVEALLLRAERGEAKTRSEALVRAATILSGRLDRTEQAIGLLERAYQLCPEEDSILERHAELLLITGDTERAEQELVALAERGYDAVRCLERARRFAHRRGDRGAEAAYLRRLAWLRPGDRETLSSLVQLLAELGDTDGEASALEELAELDPQALLELARLRSGPLDDQVGAFNALSRFLEHSPRHAEALLRMAEVCKRLGRLDERVKVLRRFHSIEESQLRRADVAVTIARLLERTGHMEEAEDVWRQALDDAPEDGEALVRLVRNLSRREKWAPLCDLLERKLENGDVSDVKAAAALATLLAETHLDRLNNPEAATRWLSWAARHPEADRAYRKLKGLLRERGQHGEVAELLETRCRHLEGEDLANELEELAQLQEVHLKDLRAAARSYAAAHRASPDGRPGCAVRAQALLVRTNELEPALALLDELIPATEGQIRGELHASRGRILALRGQISEAVTEYKSALEHNPSLHATRAELGRRLFELGRYDAAVPHLEAAAELHDRPTEREACAFLAQRAMEKLGLSRDESRRTVTRELAAVSVDARGDARVEGRTTEPLPAATASPKKHEEAFSEEPQDPEQLVAHQRKLAARCEDPQRRADLLVRAAGTMEDRLGRPLDAFKVYEEAAAAAPEHLPALEALADAAYRNQNWHRARELYDQLWLQGSTLPRDEICYRRGLVHETLGDDQTADLSYSHAVTVNPSHRESLEGKARLALARDDVEGAIEALTGLNTLISVDEIESLSATRAKLGELHLRVSDYKAARDCLESALSLDPTQTKVMQTLINVYQHLKDFHAMAEILDKLVRSTANPLVRASLLHYRAEILGAELGKEHAAVNCLLKAFDLAPNYPPTLWRLIDYYWEKDDLVSVAEMGVNLMTATDLLAEEPDIRHIRLAAAMLGRGEDEQAVKLLKVALRHEELVRPALIELGQAFDKGLEGESIVALVKQADPQQRVLAVASDVLSESHSVGVETLVKLLS
jgi:tetratricopeptide (TPR) repeat protein